MISPDLLLFDHGDEGASWHLRRFIFGVKNAIVIADVCDNHQDEKEV